MDAFLTVVLTMISMEVLIYIAVLIIKQLLFIGDVNDENKQLKIDKAKLEQKLEDIELERVRSNKE